MTIKCPKCQTENPDNSRFCADCGTQLLPAEEVSISHTKTLQTPVKELTQGTTFAGRYEIIEELGTGGMGRVYKAIDQDINEEIALKLLKPEIAGTESILERFRNELKLARKISHKNVCRMYHISKEEGMPYITMEYVEGEDLKNLIVKKGKIPEGEAIRIATQVVEGLFEAHRLGVTHRDLKPQNIMIDKAGDAKIMDFGIARSVAAPGVTATGMIIGTPDYISPEQAEGEEADQRSDIYSLGVVLYEMVTGTVPFRGDTALSVALKHKAQLPQNPKKLNPELSEDLTRLILICMEKARERRYQTAEDLLADLRNVEEGLPLGTKIRPRRKTFVSVLIRKKLFIPALIVAIAIIGIALWQVLRLMEAVPVTSARPSVAIMYFKNNTGDQSLDYWRTALSDLMITDLSQSKFMYILPGDRLFKILSQLNQLEARSFSSDILKQVAAQGKVNHIITGDYVKAGDIFRISVMLQEAETGKLIGSERVEGTGEGSFFSMVDDLTRRIKANFNFSSEQIANDLDKEVGNITTNSPDAYYYLSEGIRYRNRGDWPQSTRFLERAIAIDPECAMAYIYIAKNYGNMGYVSEGNKYIQKALELTDRVSDRDLYEIQGFFFKQSDKTYDKAIEAYKKLLQLYPEDWMGNNVLGMLYEELEKWDKAIERYEVNIQNKVEQFQSYGNTARSYMTMGMYDKATEILEYYLNNVIDSAPSHYHLAFCYLCQGRYDLALIEVDKSYSLNPALFVNFWIKGDIYHCQNNLIAAEKEYRKLLDPKEQGAHLFLGRRKLASLYLLEGRFEQSIDELKQGIELAELQGESWWKGILHLQLAYRYLKLGNLEEVLTEYQEAWNSEHEYCQRWALFSRGLVYLEMESIEDAQKKATELKELIDKGLNKKAIRYYHHLMGMIELKKNNFTEAITCFVRALSYLPAQFGPWWPHNENALFMESLALAYYKKGDLEKARQEYQKILSLTVGRIFYGDIYAKSFYMLGKIYEEQGNTAEAIEHYQKFLNLWKDADPGLAEVENARERLARLKGESP